MWYDGKFVKAIDKDGDAFIQQMLETWYGSDWDMSFNEFCRLYVAEFRAKVSQLEDDMSK